MRHTLGNGTQKQYYWQINKGKCFLEISMCIHALREIEIKESDVLDAID